MKLKYLPLVLIVLFVNLASAQTPEPVHALKALHWHPDSARIAVGYADGRVEVIPAATSEVLFTFSDADGSADNVLWNHDGSKFAAGIGKKIYIWDDETFRLQHILEGHDTPVASLAWGPDNIDLASVSFTSPESGQLKFWNTLSGQERLSKAILADSLTWDVTQNRLATLIPLTIVVLDPSTAEYTPLCDNCLSDATYDMEWSPDGSKIAAATRSYIAFRDPQAANQSGIDGNGRSFYSIAWSPNSLYLVSGDSEGQVQIWNVKTSALAYEIATRQDAIYAVDWSPDGTRLAYGGTDGRLTVSASIVSGQSEGTQLRDLLTDPSCQKACYLGIEPGITTRSQVEAFLDSSKTPYDFIEYSADLSTGTFYWDRDVTDYFGGLNFKDVQTTVVNDVVTGVSLAIDVPVTVVTEAYGNPAFITDTPGNTFWVIYTTPRLAFHVSGQNPTRSNYVYIVSPLTQRNMIDSPIGVNVMDTCPTYGTPPCIVPTATPTP